MKQRARLPIATMMLIVANILAAFGAVLSPDLVQNFGFDPQSPSLRNAFTSLFLHLNILHLLGNMVFLAAVGPAVETSAGAVRFLIVYFAGGLAGVGAHYLFGGSGPSGIPLIGASACVASCAAYYSLRYIRMRVPLGPGFGVPVAVIVAVWAGLQVLGAFVSIGGVETSTGYWAHLGGLAIGVVLGVVFRAPELARLHFSYEVLEKMNERSVGATLAAADAHLEEHPDDVKVLRERAEALETIGDPEQETETLYRLLEHAPDAERPDLVIRLSELGGLSRMTTLQRTMMAERFKAERPDASRVLLLSVVKGAVEDAQRPEALLAMAGLDAEAPEGPAAWLNELFERYPMHPACDLARARGWAP